MHNSITRLRLRSIFTLAAFAQETRAIAAQTAAAPGFIEGAVLAEGRLVFWTRSVWESEAAMKAFRDSGPHRAAMPKLMAWCDEASVAHWQGEAERDWSAIYARMAAEGRASRVAHPSKAHQARRYAKMWRWSPEQRIA
ncbi:MAG: antibiotic biosynthesis monooxygenase [Hyphomonadaceae bacterium]|nr:antibiotic biosynthesis monooxygenase [Hyphomonadaceae bacterium]